MGERRPNGKTAAAVWCGSEELCSQEGLQPASIIPRGSMVFLTSLNMRQLLFLVHINRLVCGDVKGLLLPSRQIHTHTQTGANDQKQLL